MNWAVERPIGRLGRSIGCKARSIGNASGGDGHPSRLDAIMDRAILDRNQRSDSTIDTPEGPMTRARTKRFKEQLSLFMASFFKERGQPSESKTTCVHVIQAA